MKNKTIRLGKNQKHVLKRMKEGWELVSDRIYLGSPQLQKLSSDGIVLTEKVDGSLFGSLLKKDLIEFQKTEGYYNKWKLTNKGRKYI